MMKDLMTKFNLRQEFIWEKMLKVCKNQVYIFNGKLREGCSTGKPTTIHNTTIDYFIGSPVVMQNVVFCRVLDFDPLLTDVHCGIHATITCEVQSTVPTAI